jgi:hypothetical protein
MTERPMLSMSPDAVTPLRHRAKIMQGLTCRGGLAAGAKENQTVGPRATVLLDSRDTGRSRNALGGVPEDPIASRKVTFSAAFSAIAVPDRPA